MYLDKRDNMGFQVAPALIIFLVILGGGALVCCGFAVYRFWGPEAPDTNYMHRSVEQDQYMREVRERTWGKLPNYYVQRQHTYDPSSRMQPASPSVKYVDGVVKMREIADFFAVRAIPPMDEGRVEVWYEQSFEGFTGNSTPPRCLMCPRSVLLRHDEPRSFQAI